MWIQVRGFLPVPWFADIDKVGTSDCELGANLGAKGGDSLAGVLNWARIDASAGRTASGPGACSSIRLRLSRCADDESEL